MDFLNRAIDQAKDLFGTMTPGARITAGLLAVVVVVSLVFLFRGGVGAPDDFLLGGRSFSSAELDAMEGAFAKAGLSDYVLEGSRVRVPRAHKADYIAALADNQALPTNFSDYFTTQANGSSVFESKDQTSRRWRIAKQQELALIISSMHGISRAQVIYDEIQKGGFPRKTEMTASVAVQATGNMPLEAVQIKSIRTLVSSAIAGLSFQNVSVTDLNTGQNHGGGPSAGLASAEEDAYLERKHLYERQWEEKIHKAVAFVTGAVVTVDVELSKELLFREDNVTIDPQAVTIASNTMEKTSSSSPQRPAGRPGVAAQNGMANQQASISSSGGQSTSEESTEQLEKIASHGRVSKATAPLIPRKVTAAIGVPNSYYLQVWRERNPPPPGEAPRVPTPAEVQVIESEVTKNIEDMVVNLIPKLQPGEDKYPLVTVKTFEHLTPATAPVPGLADNATAWLADNWSTLGLMAVGVFSLLILRGMVKTPPPARDPIPEVASATPQLNIVSSDEDSEGDSEGPRRRFAASGTNLKEELAGMVRENPEAAANILRNWIGEAS